MVTPKHLLGQTLAAAFSGVLSIPDSENHVKDVAISGPSGLTGQGGGPREQRPGGNKGLETQAQASICTLPTLVLRALIGGLHGCWNVGATQ